MLGPRKVAAHADTVEQVGSYFGLPHPFFPGPGPVTSAAAGGQKSPILARGVGGHTGK